MKCVRVSRSDIGANVVTNTIVIQSQIHDLQEVSRGTCNIAPTALCFLASLRSWDAVLVFHVAEFDILSDI